MKKLGAYLLSFLLLLGLFPQTVLAAQSTDFEQELTQYLNEISGVRGFTVTRDDIEASLASNEESLDDFETVDELRDYLGEAIKADLSNLDYIYSEYSMDESKLNELLTKNGDTVQDYIFLYDLDYAVYFYTEDGVFERDPDFDSDLLVYLSDVSKERGFQVTQENVEAVLKTYDTSLEEFETVEDLKDFLGDVIKSDLSNLEDYSYYGLDKESILQILKENGKNINDFIYLDDLDAILESSYEGTFPVMDESQMEQLLPLIMEELGLTQDELQKLEAHFTSLEETLSNPDTLAQLESLGNRIMTLAGTVEGDTLTDEQAAELSSIYQEMLTLLQLQVNYSLVNSDGSVTSISFEDLIKSEEELDYTLKISLYNANSELLADLLINSKSLEETFNSMVNTVDQVVTEVPDKQSTTGYHTVKGGELPKTASAYIPGALMGFLVMSVGIILYLKIRKNNSHLNHVANVHKEGGLVEK